MRRQYAEAVKICRIGLLAQPALLEGRLVLGMALSALGRHDEVLQEMRVALESDGQSALAWLMKGEALVGKGDLGQAAQALEKANELDPSNVKAMQLLGEIGEQRAGGYEEMPIESTGTKEYPARAALAVKWRAASTDVSNNEPPSLPGMPEPTLPPAADAAITRHGDDGDENTTIDPDPSDALTLGPEALLEARKGPAQAVTVMAPQGRVPPEAIAPPPAKVLSRDSQISTAEVAPVAGKEPPAAVAGPDEATMFGMSAKIADPMSPDISIAAPDPRARQPKAKKLPSAAQTMLAQRDAPRRDAPASATVNGRRRDEPQGRQRDQSTMEQRAASLADDDSFDRMPTDEPEELQRPPRAGGDRLTREVDALERRKLEEELVEPLDEPFPFDDGFLLGRGEHPSSDPSISLSANEIFIVPADESNVDHTPLPRSISTGDGIDDPSIVQREPVAPVRQQPVRQPVDPRRELVPEPPRRAPQRIEAPHFVAAVPLEGMVSKESQLPPHRAVKPAHLGHPEPIGRQPSRSPSPEPRPSRQRPRHEERGVVSRAVDVLAPTGGRRSWLGLGIVAAVVVVTGLVGGLLWREWRIRARIEYRHDLALKKVIPGNYPGYQAAELLYRQIIGERDDKRAASMRAKVLAQLAFEFGESPDAAQRAVQLLTGNTYEEREARIYLALARGELEAAARQAAALLKDHPGPAARYLVGQASLLLDQPEEAGNALRTAAAEDPQNPIVLHALGLAESAVRHNDQAFEAYGKALIANSSHIATIIDRALLQLRQGIDRDTAAAALEGVVGKLIGEASPGQLARAYVGLAEIELGKGNVAAARLALSSAAARRRDHPLLLEELAKAYADAFELDPAEREARRALTVSGRLTPRLILADVALRRSRPLQALNIIEESGSTRPEALVLRALAKLELGRNAEALADAELANQLDPTLIAAEVALARIDIADGRLDAAKHRLEGVEQKGKYAEVAWAFGQVYLARKQLDKARMCFREALHRQPLLLQARLALARLLHDAGQLGEARDEVNKILVVNGAYAPARRELAYLALDLGDAVAARDEFDALADKDAKEADLDTLLGAARARLLLGDARGAEERVERALKLRPSGADLEAANCLKARALLADHRAVEAIQLLREIFTHALHGEPAALLIEAYIDYKRIDWADEVIAGTPVASRTGIELQLAKARLALEQARQSAGRQLAEEALGRLRSGHAPVWLRAQALALLGRADLELGSTRSAWDNLKKALEIDPHNVAAQVSLGLAALDLKRPEDAASAFEGALANDPRCAEAQFYLGRTRRALADPRAEDSLRQYLELEPRGTFADEARGILQGDPVTPTSDRPRNRRSGR